MTFSPICAANSRVGVNIKARQRLALDDLPANKRCNIGNVKPAVLPVPVWAAAITSRPVIIAGIASACTGDGVV